MLDASQAQQARAALAVARQEAASGKETAGPESNAQAWDEAAGLKLELQAAQACQSAFLSCFC